MGGAGAWTHGGADSAAAKTPPGAERAAVSSVTDADGKENSSPRRGPRVRMNLSGGDGRGGCICVYAQASQLGMGGEEGGHCFLPLPPSCNNTVRLSLARDIPLPLSPAQRNSRAQLPNPPGKRRMMPFPALAHR